MARPNGRRRYRYSRRDVASSSQPPACRAEPDRVEEHPSDWPESDRHTTVRGAPPDGSEANIRDAPESRWQSQPSPRNRRRPPPSRRGQTLGRPDELRGGPTRPRPVRRGATDIGTAGGDEADQAHADHGQQQPDQAPPGRCNRAPNNFAPTVPATSWAREPPDLDLPIHITTATSTPASCLQLTMTDGQPIGRNR